MSVATAVTLRPMHWTDIAAALELEVALFPHDAWSAEQFWGELAGVPATRWYVVAVDGDRLVGYAGLYAVPGADADVQSIAVAPERQGAGVGSQLLAALLDEAGRRECPRIFLEVAADNECAQHLYERRGFERVSVRRAYYGQGVDALVMRREARQ